MTFSELVKKNFYFLIQDYGFSLNSEYVGSVEYSSGNVVIVVAYDYARSFEIDLSIRFLNDKRSVGFSLGELILFKNLISYEKYKCFMSQDLAMINDYLEVSSFLIKNDFEDLIIGDSESFSLLESFSENRALEYTEKEQGKVIRAKANKEWSKKNYTAYINSLKELKGSLTAVEIKRLGIAKRKVEEL